MTADATAATVALLETALDVSVYGSDAPDDAVFNAAMPTEVVVVQPAGGTGPLDGSYAAIDAQRLEINSYGSTPYRARRLARQVHAILKPIRRRVVEYEDAVDDESSPDTVGVLVHSYTPSGGFVALREPETRWPRVLRAYVCTYAETEV